MPNDSRSPGNHDDDFDWSVTSFEGAHREQLRRWAELPLEDVVRALEEMADIAGELGTPGDDAKEPSREP